MEIKVKTLQVTAIEAAVNVDANSTPPVEEQISVNTLQQVTMIEMAGDIDASTAPLVQEQILPLAQPGAKLLLDMTKVPYMSSAGLRFLLSLYRQITNKGGQLVLVGLAEEIKDTMSMTGFLDFFTTRDTLDSGLETLNVKLQVLPT
ncbi:MAG: anti-sigma factor antagonist [Aphanothece sp. CMT-3BRIN-NPC111]|jgi:anti-sigma B factor antagonist|nr:anti-sigma factor antagonist [Aphanothece sp. CMT-3BRIN-NPC111]